MSSLEASAERIARALERIADRLAAEPREMKDTDRYPACPLCGETRTLEPSPVMGVDNRVTCLVCGHNYTAEARD